LVDSLCCGSLLTPTFHPSTPTIIFTKNPDDLLSMIFVLSAIPQSDFFFTF